MINMYFKSTLFPNGIPLNIINGSIITIILYMYISNNTLNFIQKMYMVAHYMIFMNYFMFTVYNYILFEMFILFNMMVIYPFFNKKLKNFSKDIEEMNRVVSMTDDDNDDNDWIKIKIKHTGNQEITEFLDNKFIIIEMSKTKTIYDLKEEINSKVKCADINSQILYKQMYGNRIKNNVKLGEITSGNELTLYIVILSY